VPSFTFTRFSFLALFIRDPPRGHLASMGLAFTDK
jgi:hypothetical protein